jgi:hypothetical protein
LAQPGLSRTAGGAFALGRNRPRCRRTDESVVAGDGKGAGDLRRAARLHRAAHSGLGDERGRAHGGGRRGKRRGHRRRDQIWVWFPFRRAWQLEFIDWGGGDILYYASRYLTQALGNARYAAPEIVERNMREGRIGLTTRKGFLDYENLDVESYRRERLKAFVAMLGFLGLTRAPVLPDDTTLIDP